ncbi:hypothetical protein FCOIX_6123 [Fusarium coicis]|nr:hypothetical protein FCOIX_6123 [Fusarium coicis]
MYHVPSKVNLSFFADFTVIVDYYQCDSAVLFPALLWYKSLYMLPEGFGRKPILWLYISWGLDLVKTYDTPIAEILVLDELDKMTREFQEDQVDDTVWGDGYPSIDHARRCMTLGSALREKRRLDKLSPPLRVPYTGYSFAKVITMVNEFRALEKSVKNHVEYASDEDSWPVSEQEDSPKQRLKNKIDIILSDAEWLQLENFKY